ncbi:hypothetical protein R3W88_009034 [Solanum pinnatisectum]|uniref:RNase H type-1 domain-containing protein n=1 Tax=Solanum pinnatisectum TaxID=50273 RepID=A0AAV9MA99_9SOLN|nr:hypothetical protein R3W88_009034 [Solanum pinnatisectum]
MSCSIPPVQLIDTGWIDQWQDLKDRKFNEYLNWGTLISFCLWNIWIKRNHNTFNNKKLGVNTRDAISQATEFHWLIDKNTNKRGSKSTIQVSWKPPDHNTSKLNVDGSVKNPPGPGGLEGMIRNHLGLWEKGFVEYTPLTNPIRAELQALRRGLSIATNYNLSPLEINSEIIRMLKNGNLLYDDLITDCRSLMARLDITSLEYVFREQNRVADKLAKEGVKTEDAGQPILFYAG